MKTPTEFGPWTMSAHDCRMNSFWKRRLVALQCGNGNHASRRHWIGLLLLLCLVIGMPSWQLGEQAIAQEQPTTAEAPVLPRVMPAPPSVPVASGTAQRTRIPAGPIPNPATSWWNYLDQLPLSNKIVLIKGQQRNFPMPKGSELSIESGKDVFSTKVHETSMAFRVRGLNSGVGRLKLSQVEGKNDFQVVVVADPAPLQAKLAQARMGHIKVTPGVQSVILSGNVETDTELRSCFAMADELYPHVVSNILVGEARSNPVQLPQQVQLHCKVFKFTTTDAKLDGVLDKLLHEKRQSHDDGSYSSLQSGDAFKNRFGELAKTVEVKMLAEPVLTTVSGRPAAFHAGGEFPILVPQAPGTVAVEYKQFGTRIDFVPVVLKDGRIRLNLRPQLSALNYDKGHSLEIDGKKIPSLRKRWVEVLADMNAGQTMISVLVNENEEGKKVGFVTLVRPELVAMADPFAIPSDWTEVPSASPPRAAVKMQPTYQAYEAPAVPR